MRGARHYRWPGVGREMRCLPMYASQPPDVVTALVLKELSRLVSSIAVILICNFETGVYRHCFVF
jgi:hypothetical protein